MLGDFIPEGTVWKRGGREPLQWTNLTSTTSPERSKSTSTINIMLRVCTSDMMWWQLALCPHDLLSRKLHNPSLIMRKSPKWGTLHRNLIRTLHNRQDHQKQEGKSHCCSQEELKMIQWLNAVWCPGWNPRTGKRHQEKKKENTHKIQTEVTNNVSFLVH